MQNRNYKIILVSLFFLSCVFSLCFFFLETMQSLTIERAYETCYESAAEQIATFNTAIEGRYMVLESMAARLFEKDDDYNDYYNIAVRLESFQKTEYFTDVFYINSYGASVLYGEIVDLSHRDYFINAFYNQEVIESLVGPFTGESKIVMGIPIINNAEVVGVLCGTIKEEVIREWIVTEVYDRQSFSFIIDADGELVIGTNHESSLFTGSNFIDILKQSHYSKNYNFGIVLELLETKKGGYISYEYEGHSRLATFRGTDIENWTLVVITPGSILQQRVSDTIKPVLILVISIGCLFTSLCTYIVIKDRKQRKRLLLEKEEFSAAVDQSGRYVVKYNPTLDTAICIGKPFSDQVGHKVIRNFTQYIRDSQLINEESEEAYTQFMRRIKDGEPKGTTKLFIRGMDDQNKWIHVDYTLVYNKRNTVIHCIISFYDNTVERLKEIAYESFVKELDVLKQECQYVLEVNLSRDQLECVEGLPHYRYDHRSDTISYRDFIKESTLTTIHPDFINDFRKFFNSKRMLNLYSAQTYEDVFEYQSKVSGEYRWYSGRIKLVKYPYSDDIKAYVLVRDIHVEMCERIRQERLALIDSLTGVYNRKATEDKISQELKQIDTQLYSALYMIDLDNFKQVNDVKGHQAGDLLLNEIGESLKRINGNKHIVGRIGGDEFMCFSSYHKDITDVEVMCQQLTERLQFSIEEIDVSASIGCVAFKHEYPLEYLYGLSDAELYKAKNRGKGTYSLCYAQEVQPALSLIHTDVEPVSLYSLLDNMDGGIFICDVAEELVITYISSGLTKLMKNENLDEHDFFSIVHKDDVSDLKSVILLSARQHHLNELTLRFKSSSEMWFHIKLTPLSKEDDERTLIMGVVHDVTTLKLAQNEQRIVEEKMRIGMEMVSANIWEINIEQRTMSLPFETSEMMNLSRRIYSSIPQSIVDEKVIHHEYIFEFESMIEDILAGREGRTYTIRVLGKRHKDKWIKMNYRLMRDKSGRVVRAIGISEILNNIEMQIINFKRKQEILQLIGKAIVGTASININRERVEIDQINGTKLSAQYEEWYHYLLSCIVDDDVRTDMSQSMKLSSLIDLYTSGVRWITKEFIWDFGTSQDYVDLTLNLTRHPVSGDIYAFVYLKNINVTKKWQDALPYQLKRDPSTGLYKKESLKEMFYIAEKDKPKESSSALLLIDIKGLETIRQESGLDACQSLFMTISKLSYSIAGSNCLVGYVDESHICIYNNDIKEPSEYYLYVTKQRNQLLEMVKKSYPLYKIDFVIGYIMREEFGYDFDSLLKMAFRACDVASEWPDNPVVAYSEIRHKEKGTLSSEKLIQYTCVLVIDYNTNIAEYFKQIDLKYECLDIVNGFEYDWKTFSDKDYSMILISFDDQRENPIDQLIELSNKKMFPYTPTLLITNYYNYDIELESTKQGIVNYMSREFGDDVIKYKIENLLRMQQVFIDAKEKNDYENLFQHQENQLRLAEYDSLTSLYNKQAFYYRVRQEIDENNDVDYTLLRVDVDDFKMVNEIINNQRGDEILCEIANTLIFEASNDTIISRLESDHFGIFMPKASCHPEKILQALLEMESSKITELNLTFHIGVFEIYDRSMDVSAMCDRALLALQMNKSNLSKSIGYYDEELREKIVLEHQLISEIETAITQKEFEVYFQPQYDYQKNIVSGVEALVRWNHPKRGLINPSVFVPLLEQNGNISLLDEYVWGQCCRYIKKWVEEVGVENVCPISVNVSRHDLFNPKLVDILLGIIKHYEISTTLLRLEVTESAYTDNSSHLIQTVEILQKNGFIVEMDDFGSGYSSLTMLREVHVDVLKLDMTFLQPTDNPDKDYKILSSIIKMANDIGLCVIAEGVETKKQADMLLNMGCIYMQGYYFEKPITAKEYEMKYLYK